MNNYQVDVEACRSRKNRLIAQMKKLGIDIVIITQGENVQWLSGVHFAWFFETVAMLSVDGHLTLVCPEMASIDAVADEVITYEAQWYSTLRNDQRHASSQCLLKRIGATSPNRVGVEFSTFGPHLAAGLRAELLDIEPDIYHLRRFKHADELAMIRKAIAGTEKMYQRAREIIEPGINELEVFNQLQSAAVEEFGERLTQTGNDYQCGSRGGSPRDRSAENSELYILDLGPAFRGYFADNCRTIAVNGKPTDDQRRAWEFVMSAFEHVESAVKPGKSAKELFHEVQAILDESPVGVFDHHLGHGFGLFPHEAPHLNPNWDDTFQEGDVFTAEPGLYAPELRAGIRLENNYRVTSDGVELLTDFSLEL